MRARGARADAQAPAPGDGQPAVVSMEVGRGMVVAVLAQQLWRWNLISRDQASLRGAFDRFWSNMIRWMALGGDLGPGQQLSLRLSRHTIEVGQPTQIRLISRFALPETFSPQLRITAPDGSQQTLTVAGSASQLRRVIDFTPDQPGVYQVQALAPSITDEPLNTQFSAYRTNLERLQSAANPGLLRALAEQSGGKFFQATEAGELQTQLARYRAAMVVPPQPEYLWNRGWLLLVVLVWAGLEWLIRRKGGLL